MDFYKGRGHSNSKDIPEFSFSPQLSFPRRNGAISNPRQQEAP
jgi:hypothetical protein